jgi:hypothetical protein
VRSEGRCWWPSREAPWAALSSTAHRTAHGWLSCSHMAPSRHRNQHRQQQQQQRRHCSCRRRLGGSNSCSRLAATTTAATAAVPLASCHWQRLPWGGGLICVALSLCGRTQQQQQPGHQAARQHSLGQVPAGATHPVEKSCPGRGQAGCQQQEGCEEGQQVAGEGGGGSLRR